MLVALTTVKQFLPFNTLVQSPGLGEVTAYHIQESIVS